MVAADDRGECSSIGGAMWVSNTSPERSEVDLQMEKPSYGKFQARFRASDGGALLLGVG